MSGWMSCLQGKSCIYHTITDRANFHKYIHLHIIYNSSEIL